MTQRSSRKYLCHGVLWTLLVLLAWPIAVQGAPAREEVAAVAAARAALDQAQADDDLPPGTGRSE